LQKGKRVIQSAVLVNIEIANNVATLWMNVPLESRESAILTS